MATKRTSDTRATKKVAAKKSIAKKTRSKPAAGKAARPAKKAVKRWSGHVMETSDAMDLEVDIFKSSNPKKIAQSLKNSAEKSRRRKAGAFQSAMSMLNFYINRAGKNLPAAQTKILERAKDELRKSFGREEGEK